ncbi:MAG: DUF4340 domain-containing protein [Chthoniobacterales bacterium]|nr:DUF4340 domain-containing protein [Chthoniobacterales bacterium]
MFLTLAVLGGLFYLRRHVLPTRDAEEARRYAAVFVPDDISAMEIARSSDTVVLERDDAGWRIASPVADRASPENIDRILSALRFLSVRDRVATDDPAVLTESGLTTPRVRVNLRGGPEEVRIDFGSDTALPGEVFARVAGQGTVLRVPGDIVGLCTAPVESFRDARLTDLVPGDIEKFTVRRTDGEMSLRRERGKWLIEKPVQAPADPRAVDAFLESLLGLRIAKFDAPSEPESAMIPGRSAVISLTPRGGGEAMEIEIMRGEGNSAGARFAPRGNALGVDESALGIFDVSPEALRDRSVGYVDPDTVDRIDLESDGRRLDVRRADSGWKTSDGNAVDTAKVEALVELFNNTKIGAFRPNASGTGLDAPRQRLVFSAWLSENTAEDAAGGEPLAAVEIGAEENADSVFARVLGSEDTVTVPAALGREIAEFFGPPATPR